MRLLIIVTVFLVVIDGHSVNRFKRSTITEESIDVSKLLVVLKTYIDIFTTIGLKYYVITKD
jgi:hypothetical protein